MINNYISVKSIIAKLYRDLNLSSEINESHLIEWVAECLQVIGAYSQYEETHTKLELTNGRVELPCNFDKLVQITYKQKPLSWSTNSQTVYYDTCGDKIPQCCTEYNFYISSNVLITNIKDNNAVIDILYLGIKVDEEGYPMIPDDVYFSKACAAYVTYMLDYREWRKGNTTDKVMQKSEQDYLWFINSARGAANMPNVAQLERLKNVMTRLIPRMNEYNNNFKNLSEQERKFKH